MAGNLDTTTATIAAAQIASDAAHLACSMARADGDATGVYADSARHAISVLEGRLSEIRQALARLPTMEAA